MAEEGRRPGRAATPVCQLVLDDLDGPIVSVRGPEAKHLVRSLRAAPGELWQATDGRGTRARLEILEVRRGEASARVVERERVPPPACRWWLATAASGPRLDWLVEKAAELGAWGFIPLAGPGGRSGREERRTRLARAALGQCLAAWALRCAPATTLEAVLRGVPGESRAWDGVWVADPEGELPGALRGRAAAAGDLILLAGPPEGFSGPDAAILAGRKDLVRMRLGERRLRSETAALAGLAWVLLGAEGK